MNVIFRIRIFYYAEYLDIPNILLDDYIKAL